MKQGILTIIGAVGAAITSLYGGWDAGLITLVIFMAIDFLTGWAVAGIFHNSKKTEHGTLQSDVGLKGLCKKGMMLLIVLVAVRVDIMTGSDYVRDAAIIALCGNELLSILENAGLMGVPLPKVLMNTVDMLQGKERNEQ